MHEKVSVLWRCSSNDFRLIEDFYVKHTYYLPGHVKVSVLERCPSYGMSVLRGFTEEFFSSDNDIFFQVDECQSTTGSRRWRDAHSNDFGGESEGKEK